MTNYAILDTETTDLDGEPIQIAVMECKGVGDNNPTIISSYIKPETLISFGSMAVHLITNEMLAEMNPPKYDVIADQVLPHYSNYLVGHNIQFDIDVLSKKDERWLKYPTICTMELAKHLELKGKVGTVSNMGLFYYYKGHIESNIDVDAHNAVSDVQVTNFIFKKMLQEIAMDVDECYNLLSNKPFVCGFKKHEGKLWLDVIKEDKSYVGWLLNNDKLTKQERDKVLELIETNGGK